MKRTARSFLSTIYDSSESIYHDQPLFKLHRPDDLEIEIKGIQNSLSQMQTQLGEANIQLTQAKQTQKEQIDQVFKIKQKFLNYYNLSSQITSQIKDIKKSYQNCNIFYQEFSKEFELMKKNLTEGMCKLEKITQEQSMLEQNNIILKSKISKYETGKSQILTDIEKCKVSKRKLEEENDELEKTCRNLYNEVLEKKSYVQEIEAQIADIDQKIKATETANTNIEVEINENVKILENKRNESETLSSEGQKLKLELNELEEDIDETIKKQAQALDEQQLFNQRINELQDEMKHLNSVLAAEKDKEQKLKEELTNLEDTYNNEINKIDDIKKQIEDISNANISISNENKKLQQEISGKEIKLGELTQELQNIKSLLNEKKMNCKAIEAQIDNETAKQMKQLNSKKALLKELRKKKIELERQLDEQMKNQESEAEDHFSPESRELPFANKVNEEEEVDEEKFNAYNLPLTSQYHHTNQIIPTSTSITPESTKIAKNVLSKENSTNSNYLNTRTILVDELFNDFMSPRKSDNTIKNKFINRRAELAETFFNNYITSDKQESSENSDQINRKTALADALFDENTFKFNS